jgi:choline dehydrogenase-like flavoprotein
VSVETFDTVARDVELECDAVVVGTGAGGAPVACELAEAGYRVVMLEEGPFYKTADFTWDASASIRRLYRNAGTEIIYGKPNIIFSEGRCVGGSTVINGALSWRTPEKILKRWAWELGLEGLAPEKVAPVFERVERAVHVAKQDADSLGPDVHLFKRGADRLGYRTVEVQRSQIRCRGTNQCVFGCPTGAKQSTLVSYVPRALHAGATLFANCRADRVLLDGGRAAGIEARMVDASGHREGPRVRVRARVAVLACGAIHTPGLLLRNRLANSSGQLGRHLLVHPNVKAYGIFDEDVRPWQGAIQGWQVREFIDEGILITTSGVPPPVAAMGIPYLGAEAHEVMKDYNRMLMAGALVEDTTSGRVKLSFGGEPRMMYQLQPVDFDRMLRALALVAEIHFAAGARKVYIPLDGCEPFTSPDDIRKLYQRRWKPEAFEVLTVHAMGTCRMGSDPKRSVVGPWGETHDVPGLFVADASVFPSAIGVNPQISIMMLATRTAQHLVDNAGRYFGRPPRAPSLSLAAPGVADRPFPAQKEIRA